ncbi:type I polyketide synthase [Streptomyces tirandamycinicus]|uniref:type I polyketide synthase n=1 Tax=Streptomyces tirandamycinicus TaxID=2174846 RepID=UPI00226D98DA|nr:type I polyketide synthase [Streptomyces tirandamycinicus]MCY0981727.1 type I polyketide synthase [Streptomyces tirandamycinicus]
MPKHTYTANGVNGVNGDEGGNGDSGGKGRHGDNGDHGGYERIAVVGLGCRLPGDADSPAALWRLLTGGRDAVGPPSATRARQRGPESPPAGGDSGGPAARQAGYLRDVAGFDAGFFGVSGREADVLDPQHRLLLEVSSEALEHAGLPPEQLAGSATGVYVGISYNDFYEGLAGRPGEVEGSLLTNGHCVAAGRISYLLGLHGPSIALDTACSSSLVALHLACRALAERECRLALAGGVNLLLGSRTTRSFARMGMLSATGRCHTFDAAADGFVRGEGCGVVVLKRLADARRDGDRILAVIRGSAVNQDGNSDGLAAPSADAQAALFRRTLECAGVDPRDLGMIETHGTGTPVGDPIEFSSLSRVYGTGHGRCALGSVKTNVGHLEPASGIAGLIKAVLCLRHGVVPPNLHFTRWNPAISAGDTRFFVPTALTDWPVGGPRLAAVSSFGYSGTNAHVVLEQAPPAGPRRPRAPRRPGPPAPEVLLVPAGSPRVLPSAAQRLADWVERDARDVPLGDIAHTLALRRSAGRGRLGVVASSHEDLVRSLRSFAAGRAQPHVVTGAVPARVSRRPVWVFSGHGSQWPAMGRGLLEREPAFAAALTEVDALISAEAGFSVLGMVSGSATATGPEQVQPLLFAMQTSLTALWRAYGVEPAAVVGHSMGEVAAAVAAGALTLADGVKVVCRRSSLLARIAGAGAMATVSLDHRSVERELHQTGVGGEVCVAVLAAPRSTVVAGAPHGIAQLVAGWEARGVPAHAVAVDVASHSPQVDPLLPELRRSLRGLTPQRPRVPFYSTVHKDHRRAPAFDAVYWCANLRRPVRFASAIAAAGADRHRVYVEVSPHPVVTRSVAESLPGSLRDPVVLPTLRRDEDETATFRTQLAALHCAGVEVDWSVLYAGGGLCDAPVLTFDRQPHWVPDPAPAGTSADATADTTADTSATTADASADTSATAAVASPGTAALPGHHSEVPGVSGVPGASGVAGVAGEGVHHFWQADAGTDAVPWLTDHKVRGNPVFPGAGYCAVAATAACEMFGAPATDVQVTGIRFLELMRLDPHTEMVTSATVTGTGRANCAIHARDDAGTWTLLATAELHHRPGPVPPPLVPPLAELPERHPAAIDPGTLYTGMRARGIEHGPAFTGITSLRTSADGRSSWARITLPPAATRPPLRLRVHPVLIDCCAQTLVAGLLQHRDPGLALPVGAESLRVLGDPAAAVYCLGRITQEGDNGVTGDLHLLDQAGRPVVTVEGLRLVHHRPSRAAEAGRVDHWFLEPRWHTAPRDQAATASPAPGNWLVVGEGDGSAAELADRLRTAGAQAHVVDIPLADDADDADVGGHDGGHGRDRADRSGLTDGSGGVRGTFRHALRAAWTESPRGRSAEPDAVVVLCPRPADDPEPAVRGLLRTRRLLATVQAVLAGLPRPPRLFVVTRGAQTVRATETGDPGQSALRGPVRVLAYEHPELRATHLDADPADTALHDAADELLNAGPEDEIALRGGRRHVARLEYTPLTETERTLATTRTVRYGTDRFRLRIGRFGDLDGLEPVVADRTPPRAGEVEVRVAAAALNFRDVLTAMGLLADDDEARNRIGFECAGTVTAVGPGVRTARPGDDVLAVDLRGGAFGTFLTVPEHSVAPLPAGLGPTAAAALPAAYATAWYALRRVAGLTAGERVLIHSATGGTGLAAVAVARMTGAEVLATAGSPEKRAHLRGMGIEHVMDSRSTAFGAGTRAATGGEGVDVVLNSLSGPGIRAGLEALRPFGRFVELGVRDILADAPVGLGPFRDNITLSTVDLIQLQRERPEVFAAVLREVLAEIASGRLAPLPHRTYPLERSTEAFRLMAGAGHIGKIVLTVPEQGETRARADREPSPVHSDGSYIVTGGLRGVGLETARWLAARGAGHVVVNGRSAGPRSTSAALDELRARGTRVTVVLGDIAEPGTAERLVTAATADGLRLRGLVHAAMVLDDAVVTNISDDQLTAVWRPKAVGAWRLHEATAGHNPDWFVVYSSMASLLGNPGQGAYAAANAWLDGFAAWRTGRGLPTLAVNWGPWGETGAAVDFAERGYRTIPTQHGLQALGSLLVHRRTRTGVIPGEPETWILPAVRQSSLFGLLTDDGAAPAEPDTAAPDIRGRLASLPPGLARRAELEEYLTGHIRAVLRLGDGTVLDPQTPLKSLGFDSLLSLELRTRLETGLGIKIAGDFVYQHPTLAALAAGLAGHMGLPLEEHAES